MVAKTGDSSAKKKKNAQSRQDENIEDSGNGSCLRDIFGGPGLSLRALPVPIEVPSIVQPGAIAPENCTTYCDPYRDPILEAEVLCLLDC